MGLKTLMADSSKVNYDISPEMKAEFDEILASENVLNEYEKLSLKKRYYLNEYVTKKLFKK